MMFCYTGGKTFRRSIEISKQQHWVWKEFSQREPVQLCVVYHSSLRSGCCDISTWSGNSMSASKIREMSARTQLTISLTAVAAVFPRVHSVCLWIRTARMALHDRAPAMDGYLGVRPDQCPGQNGGDCRSLRWRNFRGNSGRWEGPQGN